MVLRDVASSGPDDVRPRVAVIGLGVIGKSQVRMLSAVYDVVTYDVADGTPYPEEDLASCDFAVICVGTPESGDGSANLSYVGDAVFQLRWQCVSRNVDPIPILIRSTMPPGTTDKIKSQSPAGGIVAHAPEFMYERPDAEWTEATHVPFMVLGGDEEARAFFAPRLALSFSGKIHECSALEAELVKYTVNLYWASRVTFVNEMSRIAAVYGADWERVRAGWLMHPWVSEQYTTMSGFSPGFGGRCWPKDLAALIVASREAGYDAPFLNAIQDANRRNRRHLEECE